MTINWAAAPTGWKNSLVDWLDKLPTAFYGAGQPPCSFEVCR
jgi:hypothetical protein